MYNHINFKVHEKYVYCYINNNMSKFADALRVVGLCIIIHQQLYCTYVRVKLYVFSIVYVYYQFSHFNYNNTCTYPMPLDQELYSTSLQ